MRKDKSADGHSDKFVWLFAGIGIPVVLVALLVAVFFINNRPPNIVVPMPKMPKPNGYDDFVRATKLIGSIRSPMSDTRPVSSWTVGEFEAFVNNNAGATAALREGLGKQCMHPPTRSYAIDMFENNAAFRELARILAGEAMYYNTIGDYTKATDSYLDCIEFGVMMPRGGSLVDHLVGNAIEGIGSVRLAPMPAKLNLDALKQTAIRLEQIENKRTSYHDIMMQEARASAACLNDLHRHRQEPATTDIKSWFYDDVRGKMNSTADIKYNIKYAFTNKRKAILEVKEYYEAIAKAEQGYYKGLSKVPVPTNVLAQFANGSNIGYPYVRVCFVQREAIISLLKAEVALRRYRFDHNSYPVSLKALMPKYLNKTPVDPFGQGKPLRYKPLNNNQDFLLYSLGPNFKDDGGVQGYWKGVKTKGDIVAKKW